MRTEKEIREAIRHLEQIVSTADTPQMAGAYSMVHEALLWALGEAPFFATVLLACARVDQSKKAAPAREELKS